MILKDILKIYKEERAKAKEQEKLLHSNWDVQFLQDAIRKVNRNPGLKVKMAYPDGRYLELSTFYEDKRPKNPYIVEEV